MILLGGSASGACAGRFSPPAAVWTVDKLIGTAALPQSCRYRAILWKALKNYNPLFSGKEPAQNVALLHQEGVFCKVRNSYYIFGIQPLITNGFLFLGNLRAQLPMSCALSNQEISILAKHRQGFQVI